MPTLAFLDVDEDGCDCIAYPSGHVYDFDTDMVLVRATYRPSLARELEFLGYRKTPDGRSFLVPRRDFLRISEPLSYRPRIKSIPRRYRTLYPFRHLKPSLA